MELHLDEIMVVFLKALAVCVIIGGIMAVPAQLQHTTSPNIYTAVAETELSAK